MRRVAVFPPSGDRHYLFSPALPSARARDQKFFQHSLPLGATTPVDWAKAVGRETLRTGGKMLTDISKIMSPDVRTEDIISKHVGVAVIESTQRLINKLRGRRRKHVRRETPTTPGRGSKSLENGNSCPSNKK